MFEKEENTTEKMKKKIITNIILISLIALTTAVSILAVTLSWFSKSVSISQEYVIKADGVLYLYIPTAVEKTEKTLTPAKAMRHAVTNGLYMDVLREYNEGEENPSWVEKKASIASYSTHFVFYNEYRVNVQAVDENGQPIFDENGNPVYVPVLDENGNPVLDENGNPMYQTQPAPATISYAFAVKDKPSDEEGEYIDNDEFVITSFYFSYYSSPIPAGLPITPENGAIPFIEKAEDNTSGSLRVQGTSDIYIHMELHIAQVDELMEPKIRGENIYIEISLGVVLDGPSNLSGGGSSG